MPALLRQRFSRHHFILHEVKAVNYRASCDMSGIIQINSIVIISLLLLAPSPPVNTNEWFADVMHIGVV